MRLKTARREEPGIQASVSFAISLFLMHLTLEGESSIEASASRRESGESHAALRVVEVSYSSVRC